MLIKWFRKALKNNAFKAVKMVFVGFTATSLVLGVTACRPYEAVKSVLAEDAMPPMPAPEVATYVLDLSGSTNPTAQLEALGSGIEDFIAGRSLGNPVAKSPEAPRGLSIQFITANAAQSPRIQLVSVEASQNLYKYVVNRGLNLEGSTLLWNGFIKAREQIWQDPVLDGNPSECVTQVVAYFGKQQLGADELQEPARLICQDAKKTANALKRLTAFTSNPNVTLGSDVEGALIIGLKNLTNGQLQFPSARLTLVVASDLIDEVGLDLPSKLAGSDSNKACELGTNDASRISADYSAVSVVLVGARNSIASTQLLDRAGSYWGCYFNQIGITNIEEKSDLSGF
jgi:hypothetical protein